MKKHVRASLWAQLLLLNCVLGTGCAIHDLEYIEPGESPPVVSKHEVLPPEAAAQLLESALKEYADDPKVRELVKAVRAASTAPLTAGNDVRPLVDGPQ